MLAAPERWVDELDWTDELNFFILIIILKVIAIMMTALLLDGFKLETALVVEAMKEDH